MVPFPYLWQRWMTLFIAIAFLLAGVALMLSPPQGMPACWLMSPFMLFAAFSLWSYKLWRPSRPWLWAGRCRKCGYDLTGNTSGRCPECGQPATAKKTRG
ncbi:MAG: hypothetical protein JXQ73_06360 [Phycisphaerae bacterium]|nr:hypothetical protein [Phycisphaerae bacterium]